MRFSRILMLVLRSKTHGARARVYISPQATKSPCMALEEGMAKGQAAMLPRPTSQEPAHIKTVLA